jgi:ubiquinone/menaquinone biosynthesis C-methylase UbiE
MKTIKPRIPEGGAIEDNAAMTMEQYSEIMKKHLWKDYIRFANNVINKINPTQGSKVLEIGSGPGWAGINLVKKRNDLKLDGWEASADMVQVATANASNEGISNFEFKVGVGENMRAIEDGTYDVVISRDSLHHWVEPEKVFSEIKRVLKPTGKVYIQDPRRDMNGFGRFIVNVVNRFLPNNMGFHWKNSIAASYTLTEIRHMLDNIGLNNWSVNAELMDLTVYKK